MKKFLSRVAAQVAALLLIFLLIYLGHTVISHWLERLLNDLYVLLFIIVIVAILYLYRKLRNKAT